MFAFKMLDHSNHLMMNKANVKKQLITPYG